MTVLVRGREPQAGGSNCGSSLKRIGRGQPYRSSGSSAATDPIRSRCRADWPRPYASRVNDLPLDSRVGCAASSSYGHGQVWIDDVQLYDVLFPCRSTTNAKREKLEFSQADSQHQSRLRRSAAGGLRRALDGYWPRFLMEYLPPCRRRRPIKLLAWRRRRANRDRPPCRRNSNSKRRPARSTSSRVGCGFGNAKLARSAHLLTMCSFTRASGLGSSTAGWTPGPSAAYHLSSTSRQRAGLLHAAEVGPHFCVLRMELRVLDAELAHVGQAALGAVELFGQAVVLGDHVALLVERGRLGQRQAGGQGPALARRSTGCRSRRGRPSRRRRPCSAIMSRQAWASNRSPLPSTTRSPACCFTSRRNSHRDGPS